jgi:hypothetical protein
VSGDQAAAASPTWVLALFEHLDANIGHLENLGRRPFRAMKKIHTAVVTTTMVALALALAPHASADFNRPGYLRCMASDAMSVGGVPLDSSTLGKIGAEAYNAGSGPTVIAAVSKKYKLSEGLATLIVQCAQGPQT